MEPRAVVDKVNGIRAGRCPPLSTTYRGPSAAISRAASRTSESDARFRPTMTSASGRFGVTT